MEFGPDDVFDVAPGHDAWVVGDEPFETIDWVGAHRWASPPAGDRVLATIVMTDIVDSTARAAELGDVAWRWLLERHHTILRRQLDRFGGREVVTTGDGMLALFDGAERAVRGAAAMVGAIDEIDLRIRAGVHTGEVEYVPGNVRGVAVHVASRIMALAGPGEVLVSDTTRGLIESRELALIDRGRHALKGVSEERTIFAVGVSAAERAIPFLDSPRTVPGFATLGLALVALAATFDAGPPAAWGAHWRRGHGGGGGARGRAPGGRWVGTQGAGRSLGRRLRRGSGRLHEHGCTSTGSRITRQSTFRAGDGASSPHAPSSGPGCGC